MFVRQYAKELSTKKVVLLAVLIILLLFVGTSVLLLNNVQSFFPDSNFIQQNPSNAAPALTLSTSQANVGQSVRLDLTHFPPSTLARITHDVGEVTHTNTGSSAIKIGPDGTADVIIHIDTAWKPGPHIIGVEDTTTLYARTIPIQISTG